MIGLKYFLLSMVSTIFILQIRLMPILCYSAHFRLERIKAVENKKKVTIYLLIKAKNCIEVYIVTFGVSSCTKTNIPVIGRQCKEDIILIGIAIVTAISKILRFYLMTMNCIAIQKPRYQITS